MGVSPQSSQSQLSAQAQLKSLLELQAQRDKLYNGCVDARSKRDTLKVKNIAERVDLEEKWKGLSPAFALKSKYNLSRGEAKVREHTHALHNAEHDLQNAFENFQDKYPDTVESKRSGSDIKEEYSITLGTTKTDITLYKLRGTRVNLTRYDSSTSSTRRLI